MSLSLSSSPAVATASGLINKTNNPFTTRTALRPMPAKSSPIRARSELVELTDALHQILVASPDAPLHGQAQVAAAGVEATSVIYTVQATLLAATSAEQVIKTARTLHEHASLLMGTFNGLRLTETERDRVRELEVMLGAALTLIRESKVVDTYVELARIAAHHLRTIPVPEDDTLDHATTTITTGLDGLPPSRQTDIPPPQHQTMSSDDSSNISTIGEQLTTDEAAALLKAEVKNFKRCSRQWTPPPFPTVFRAPASFLTLQAGKESDPSYTYNIAVQVWKTTDHCICSYNGQDVPYIQLGTHHRALFFTLIPDGPIVWGSTKRIVANAYVNEDYRDADYNS
jgi:hypothetical protein